MSRLLPRVTRSAFHGKPQRRLPSPQALSQGTIAEFRKEAFTPKLPATFPPGHFLSLPAIRKWFKTGPLEDDETGLNREYLVAYMDAIMQFECKTKDSFERVDAPFAYFLHMITPDPERENPRSPESSVYLAQQSIQDLPKGMSADLPTPEIVLNAGKGDIYDASIWMGLPPTYTPLHRDPNPNLFVQLSGTKLVRMLPPEAGSEMFAWVQKKLAIQGSSKIRGSEMMVGPENSLLESLVWEEKGGGPEDEGEMLEVEVNAGDGLFIPTGWWHSVKGTGDHVTGSVNWWFR